MEPPRPDLGTPPRKERRHESGMGRTAAVPAPQVADRPGAAALRLAAPRPGARSAAAMAVEVGFEPTEELPLHTLSRRAPSATRRLHRRRAYRRSEPFRLPALTEESLEQGGALLRQHSPAHLDWRPEPGIMQDVPD